MSSTKKNIKFPFNIISNIKTAFTQKNNASSESPPRPIRVALLIDEYFGGAGTAYGGYGFLARRYIAKYIPNKDIQLDVLLNLSKKNGTSYYRWSKCISITKKQITRKTMAPQKKI